MATPRSSIKRRGKVFYLRFSENGVRKRVSLHTDSPEVAKERQRQFDSARARGGGNVFPTKTPLADAVAAYVAQDKRFEPFYDRVLDLTRLLLPAYIEEGKSHLSIAFGCTGGQHRSVSLAETLAKALAEDGRQVSIRHRELERRALEKRPE